MITTSRCWRSDLNARRSGRRDDAPRNALDARTQGQADMTRALYERIRALERSEKRLKTRLAEEKESLKDAKSNLRSAQHQASILEERLDNEGLAYQSVLKELERYRGWWLNEYYCLKVALQLITEPDDGVLAMGESSRARFMIHLASQSDSAQ